MFDNPQKIFALFGAFFACLGVAAGAFGAHALKTRLSAEMLAVFEVGVRYQLVHSLALFVIAWALGVFAPWWCTLSGSFLVLGIVFFSGSIYALALSNVRTWGAITPIGGVFFLLGWLFLAIGIMKS
jgi:uncharacterized membrane protein YgdD (TMEM256/DUF423 family)